MSAPTLLAVARQVRGPTIIVPLGRPEEDASFEALLDRVRILAAGRPVEFKVATISHPDVDTFHGLQAKVDGFIVATLGDRWHDEGDVRAALRIAQASFAEARPRP